MADGGRPVDTEAHLADFAEDQVRWSREYSDPGYAVQFTQALEASAAAGIAPRVH
jgi:hypothetical protein